MVTCKEIWKTIEGFPNYMVSTLGRVKSIERTQVDWDGRRTRKFKSKILKQKLESNGYYRVSLYEDSKRKDCMVHRLVAKTFIDNLDNKPEVNHLDGDKLNNKINNLEWCTGSENVLHAFRIGTRKPTYKKKA